MAKHEKLKKMASKALHSKMGKKDKLPPMSEKRKANVLKVLNGKYSMDYQDKLLKQK